MYRFSVLPCHTLTSIMHELVDNSLCKIFHRQQNVPQLYYLLDTLVNRVRVSGSKPHPPPQPLRDRREKKKQRTVECHLVLFLSLYIFFISSLHLRLCGTNEYNLYTQFYISII